MFVGKNPWQSHGFPRARAILREIAGDPGRALVVIDPRRTETAELADHHLQVRPGTDAFCLSALLAVLVEEDLVDHPFLAQRTSNGDTLVDALRAVPIADYCARAGIAGQAARGPYESGVPRRLVFEDSASQAPHGTLNSWKLVYLLTGNPRSLADRHHTRMAGLGGGRSRATEPVGGHRIITGDSVQRGSRTRSHRHRRFRAAIVESTNRCTPLAASQRMRGRSTRRWSW